MAAVVRSRKLVCTFGTADGSDVDYTFNYVSSEVEGSDVKTLMETMVTNGDVYQKVPTTIKSAKVVITEDEAITLPED